MEILYIAIFAASYKVLHSTAKMFVANPAVNAVVNEHNFHGESKRIIQASLPLLPLVSLMIFMSSSIIRDNLLFNLTAILLCLLSGEYFFVNNKHKGSGLCFHTALMVGDVHLSMLLMALMNVYLHLFQSLLHFLFAGK